MRLNQVTLPSRDIARSKAFYEERLGFELLVDTPAYLRFLAPEGDATLSLHLEEDGPAGAFSAWIYLECEDVDAAHARLSADGVAFEPGYSGGPVDQGWLWREARLLDPDGNRIILFQAGENRINPPWRVGGPR